MITHPRLYKRDSKGRVRFWQVQEDGEGAYRTVAGLADGRAVTSEWTRCEPKNVGRSNATTARQQCAMEVDSLYDKKYKKHYVDSVGRVDDDRRYFEVMLAHSYKDHRHKIDFSRDGVFTQPKLDGLRAPTHREGVFSRDGNEFKTVRFIRDALQPIFDLYPNLVIDGELYNHDYRDDFNSIVSAIKREHVSPEDDVRVRELAQLHVYDLFDPDRPWLPFHERSLLLHVLIGGGTLEGRPLNLGIDRGVVRVVPTHAVESFTEIDERYEGYLDEEYEGQIVRIDDRYHHKRVAVLLKRKEFVTDEFPVVRVESGKGNWSGAAKRIICALPDGREFGAGKRGTLDENKRVLAEAETYKTATVRYPNLTPDGKPRFGVVTRLYQGPRDE